MAITNFEKQTHELTEHELNVLTPIVRTILKGANGKNNVVNNRRIRVLLITWGYGTLGAARVRKIINYLRITGQIQRLIASSKGYYIAQTEEEMELYIDSLDQRINSIELVRDQMFYQLDQMRAENAQCEADHKQDELKYNGI